MQHEELILKYFNKTLTNNEEVLFSNLLNKDADFKTLFDEHKNMQLAFEINEKEKLKLHLQNLESSKKSVFKTILNQKFIVFATACCLLIGGFYFINNSSSNLYDNYFEVYPNVLEPVVRGEMNIKSDAFIAYENQNYQVAENNFKLILETNPDDNIRFYYALTLLNQNKTKPAQKVLNSLKQKNHDFLPEIYWYSALIAVKNHDFKLALKELQALQGMNSTFKKEEIKKLIEDLN